MHLLCIDFMFYEENVLQLTKTWQIQTLVPLYYLQAAHRMVRRRLHLCFFLEWNIHITKDVFDIITCVKHGKHAHLLQTYQLLPTHDIAMSGSLFDIVSQN